MKVGVLGRGSIGLRHFYNLQSLGIEAVSYDSAMDPPLVRDKVLDCDAVVIATPTSQHIVDLHDAYTAGRKFLLIEKPVGRPEDIEALPQFLGITAMVGNNLRFHGCVRAARQMLQQGAVGVPLWASITVSQYTQKDPYLRDGVLLNWGAHEIDLALYLLGPASVLSACINGPPESMADIVLGHESGCRSAIHLDYVTRPEIRAFTIVGSKGRLTLDLVERWGCLSSPEGKHTQFTTADTWDLNYIDEMKTFVSLVNNHNTALVDITPATLWDGVAALKIIKDAREKAK